jgi:hypothetical protein
VRIEDVGNCPAVVLGNVDVPLHVEGRIYDHAVGASADHVRETALAASAQLNDGGAPKVTTHVVERRRPRSHTAVEYSTGNVVVREHPRTTQCSFTLRTDHDDVVIARYLVNSPLELSERNVVHVGDLPVRDLAGFTHIEQIQQRVVIEERQQFLRGDC